MKKKRKQSSQQQGPQARKKKAPYAAPQLTRFGDMRRLTAMMPGPGADAMGSLVGSA